MEYYPEEPNPRDKKIKKDQEPVRVNNGKSNDYNEGSKVMIDVKLGKDQLKLPGSSSSSGNNGSHNLLP